LEFDIYSHIKFWLKQTFKLIFAWTTCH